MLSLFIYETIFPSCFHWNNYLFCSTLLFYFREEELPVEKIVTYVSKLQQPDGSFYGDIYGEVDTRFSFCAVACLSLLVRWVGLFQSYFTFHVFFFLYLREGALTALSRWQIHIYTHRQSIRKKYIWISKYWNGKSGKYKLVQNIA